ncbi:MAG: hypothetical protein AAF806_18900 [Bacteroidota bacterium]
MSDQAAYTIDEAMHMIINHVCTITREPRNQKGLATSLGVKPPTISLIKTTGEFTKSRIVVDALVNKFGIRYGFLMTLVAPMMQADKKSQQQVFLEEIEALKQRIEELSDIIKTKEEGVKDKQKVVKVQDERIAQLERELKIAYDLIQSLLMKPNVVNQYQSDPVILEAKSFLKRINLS